MSYIRTKDSIVERSRVKFLGNNKAELSDEHGSWQVDDLQIIDEADSVDELFDEIIYDYDGDCRFELPSIYCPDAIITYGAIWARGEHDEPILKTVARKVGEGWVLT